MRARKSIALTVLLLAATSCCAQFSEWWNDHRYGIHAAYAWQGNSAVELGVYRMWSSNPLYVRRQEQWNYGEETPMINWSPVGFWSTGAAIEFPFGAGEFVTGPKLFSELNMSIVSFRLSTTAYTNFKRTDLRVTPGAGLSFFGTFGVCYERNIVLGKTIFEAIQPNRVTVFINIIPEDFPAY